MQRASIFILFIAFVPIFSLGQETKKVIDKEKNETYYVLKSDKATKHGEYQKFGYNNALILKGNFKNGIKDGVWECYDFDGALTLRYDYSGKNLLFYKARGAREATKWYGVAGADTSLTRPAIYLNGGAFIASEIIKNLKMPRAAVENRKSGRVNVLFTVDRSGKTTKHRVDEPVGFGMDEEAIRVLKLIPEDWLPAVSKGQVIEEELSYPISFRLGS
ncbi:MAG: TonB family protein [Sphingobacteriaceae bacterium]|jgi:TonB family protein|nr:TonB family protein [Sphingobacteriaceae bacterium]